LSFTADKPLNSNLARCNFDVFRKDLVEARKVAKCFVAICAWETVFQDFMDR